MGSEVSGEGEGEGQMPVEPRRIQVLAVPWTAR
jgi:hypothetical protein